MEIKSDIIVNISNYSTNNRKFTAAVAKRKFVNKNSSDLSTFGFF